jgi:hypothetical protein
MDDSRYFGLRAVSLPDRRIVVTVAFVVDSFAALLVEVDRLTAEGCKFAISPSIDIQWPRHLETKKVIVGYGEILKYTPTVRNLIAEKMLLHDGSTQLAEHVSAPLQSDRKAQSQSAHSDHLGRSSCAGA